MGHQGGGAQRPLAGASRQLLGCAGLRPGAQSVATDVCVPISRLAECVAETQRDIQASGLVAPIVGHVGDGNFHLQPLVDIDNPAEVAACEALIDRLVEQALAMEGTCTGEHGIGQKKMKYLELEHGAGLSTSCAASNARSTPRT